MTNRTKQVRVRQHSYTRRFDCNSLRLAVSIGDELTVCVGGIVDHIAELPPHTEKMKGAADDDEDSDDGML